MLTRGLARPSFGLIQTASRTAPRLSRGLLQSVLYGSPEAKKEGELEIQQFSKVIGRGKYIHSFETHRIKPQHIDDYKKASEAFYTGVAQDPTLNVKLTGGWETVIGAMDTYVHVLEYENYKGFDESTALIKNSKHHERYMAMVPFLESRNTQLCQEFAFWASSPPRTQGGIFELRTYLLHPGTLLEWEQAWRIGIEARKQYASPVGAWFSQVGRLHQVHHMWQYKDLHTRKEVRQNAWQVDGWSETVHKTAKMAKTMDSTIMEPLPYSPLR